MPLLLPKPPAGFPEVTYFHIYLKMALLSTGTPGIYLYKKTGSEIIIRQFLIRGM